MPDFHGSEPSELADHLRPARRIIVDVLRPHSPHDSWPGMIADEIIGKMIAKSVTVDVPADMLARSKPLTIDDLWATLYIAETQEQARDAMLRQVEPFVGRTVELTHFQGWTDGVDDLDDFDPVVAVRAVIGGCDFDVEYEDGGVIPQWWLRFENEDLEIVEKLGRTVKLSDVRDPFIYARGILATHHFPNLADTTAVVFPDVQSA